MTEERAARSRVMRSVRGYDTGPEMTVRKIVRSIGFPGYRLRRKDLPGNPDLAFIGRHKAVFVHGCFWHGHNCSRGARIPKSNREYWVAKIARNCERDAVAQASLKAMGWEALVVWECELRELSSVEARLADFLRNEDGG